VSKQGTIEDVLAGRADWALECRDGFALARELADGAVDHVIGDPPYDEKTHKGARTTSGKRAEKSIALSFDGVDSEHKANGNAADADINFAVLPPTSEFVPSLIRAAKRWVIAFCALEQLGTYRDASGELWIRGGIWVRTNGTPQITGDRPAQGGEGLAIIHRVGRKRWNGHGNPASWIGPRDSDPRRMHPTKKPAWLMEALIRDFTDPGELIYDPCSGEGSTGEACIKLGRRFIGCELDPKYHAAGVARIDRAARGLKQIDLLAV
jgi:site-specific DNA-methyltransferase (adenine-specific)